MSDKQNNDTNPQDWDANMHYQDLKVSAEYDAKRFSSVAGRVFNNWEKQVIRRAFGDLAAGSRIGDLPCGTGRLAEPLLDVGFRVHGMDISGEMLQVASQQLQRFGDAFTTEVVDAKNLDRQHEQYDAVLCARVLMHFELSEQIEFLRGVAKLTSGVVVINHSFSSPYQRFRRGIKRILRNQASARHPVTANQIRLLLAEAGLREVRHFRLNPIVSEAIYIVAAPLGS